MIVARRTQWMGLLVAALLVPLTAWWVATSRMSVAEPETSHAVATGTAVQLSGMRVKVGRPRVVSLPEPAYPDDAWRQRSKRHVVVLVPVTYRIVRQDVPRGARQRSPWMSPRLRVEQREWDPSEDYDITSLLGDNPLEYGKRPLRSGDVRTGIVAFEVSRSVVGQAGEIRFGQRTTGLHPRLVDRAGRVSIDIPNDVGAPPAATDG